MPTKKSELTENSGTSQADRSSIDTNNDGQIAPSRLGFFENSQTKTEPASRLTQPITNTQVSNDSLVSTVIVNPSLDSSDSQLQRQDAFSQLY